MGKSEVVTITLERPDPTPVCGLPIYITPPSDNDIKKIDEQIKDKLIIANSNELQIKLPDNMELFANQVAGHGNDGQNIGLIKWKDKVLKPILANKRECGEREIQFYESLDDTVDWSLKELKNFVPKYYGVQTVPVNGKNVDCIVLDNVTKYYKEPCIMDIKIGRRTWGPGSSYKKIMNEEMKFHECKRDLGFCIPGFQVYNVRTNEFHRFGKDFGKQLDKDSAEDAIKLFLNSESGFNRSLIVQFLATLWRIQHWARNQRRLRLYSSSILLIYDARRLRECLKMQQKTMLKLTRKNSLYRPMSLAVLNKGNQEDRIPTGFSGQLTKEGPILRPPTSPSKLITFDAPTVINNNNVWKKSIRSLKRTHSFQNNYDKEVQNKKQDYTYILDDLVDDEKAEMWAMVKMIDFAHVHPADSCDIDRNYLNGIENLVRIFEEFLIESE